MTGALRAAASGMEAQQAQIEQISNNLANVNTNGYKKSRAEFQDLLYENIQEAGAKTSATTQAPVGIQRGMGVKVSGTQRNFEMGTPVHTNRDLDMMIKGDGFFVVQLPDGTQGYRRDGSFYKSATGRLETIDGYALLPEVTIPSEAKRIEINEDGTIHALLGDESRQQLGQVQLATFVNNGGLKPVGKNTFVATEGSGPGSLTLPGQNNSGSLLHKYVEGSNVDIVREMTDMISAQRAFEMNSKVIQAVDQILQHTVNVR